MCIKAVLEYEEAIADVNRGFHISSQFSDLAMIITSIR